MTGNNVDNQNHKEETKDAPKSEASNDGEEKKLEVKHVELSEDEKKAIAEKEEAEEETAEELLSDVNAGEEDAENPDAERISYPGALTERFYINDKKQFVHEHSHQLQDSGDKVGTRTTVDTFTKKGIRRLAARLISENKEFIRTISSTKKQLKDIGDVEIDEEFLKKYRSIQNMTKKETLVNQKKDLEGNLDMLQLQLRKIRQFAPEVDRAAKRK